MVALRPIGLVSLIAILFFYSGCSTSKNVDTNRRNLRQQLTVQRQLQRLNRQNEKLMQTLKGSSVINIETGDVLDNNFINKNNIPEISRLLRQFTQINLETQRALKSLEQSIQNDTDRNLYIDQMLNGFAVACEQQEARLDQIRDGLNQRNSSTASFDNVHIGISTQYMSGSTTQSSSESNQDQNLNFGGLANSLYFNYVVDNGAAITLKYMALSGINQPQEETENGSYTLYNAQMGMIGVGFKILWIHVFNVVPQILYGTGESKIYGCDQNGCLTDIYYKAKIDAFGLEIPFYHQLSSAFSWGFKFSGYKITSSSLDLVLNGEVQGELPVKLEITSAAVGLMIGAAW